MEFVIIPNELSCFRTFQDMLFFTLMKIICLTDVKLI